MTHLHLDLLFGPAVVALVALAVLLQERRPRPKTDADKRAIALLRSWLTPEQDMQWTVRGEFEVVGCDTGARYRITYRPVMNVLQLDPNGRPAKQLCFTPQGSLSIGDVLLAQKIALETMEREALLIANSQRPRI
jgi:hypothetical protein